MPATTGQVAPAQEAGRPQPQTTIEPPGGPFVRHSQPGRRSQYQSSGNAFGQLITQPLVAAPGYARALRLQIAASGGTGTATVAATADAPFSAVQQVILRDAFGTPIIVGPGFEVLHLIPKYGGQFGLGALSDVTNLPSYSAVATGADASGDFSFSSSLPLEFAKAYGLIAMANASLLPTLQLQLAPSSAVYSTPPTTLPTVQANVDLDFYWLPEGVSVEPPGLGTTCQWVMAQGSPTVGANGTTKVSLPRLGGFLNTIILVLRDSTGARVDAWPERFRLYVDGVPLLDTSLSALEDDMQIQYASVGTGTNSSEWTRDVGVLAITRKTSLSQVSQGLLDTGETYLSTNPGTLLEVEGAPWGSGGTPPYTLNVLAGQVVPAGSLIQGLPEL